jgi:hypothetical protein
MPLTEEEKKERKRAYMRAWNAKNKKAIAGRRKDYWKKNKDSLTETQNKWRTENREKMLATMKEYYSKHKDKAKVYRGKNKESRRANKKAWDIKNKTKIKEDTRLYNIKNRDELLRKKQHGRDSLCDTYIKSRICQRSSLAAKHIPQSLINVKRTYIKGLRLIKEQEDERQKDQECR